MSSFARFAVVMIAVSVLGPSQAAQLGARDRVMRLNEQIVQLMNRGDITPAAKLAQQTLAFAEKALGKDDLATATTMGNFSVLLGKLGYYNQSESYGKQALSIREKNLPINHPDIASSITNLAFLYKEMGRYAEAEPLFKRGLAIEENAYGLEDLEVANTVNSLGLLYIDEKRFAEAEPLIKRGLAIREKKLGAWHIDVARSVNSLAFLYHHMERYDEQEKLLERSLAIREKVARPTDPALATALDNLASFYRERKGLFTKAEPLAKRALAIYTAAYGPFHPDIAITTHNLMLIYQSLRRTEEIEKLLTQSLEIFEKTAGPKHQSVAEAANNLARHYFEKHDFARATEFWRRSASIISERALQDANETAKPLSVGGEKANIEFSGYFTSLIKAAFRAAHQHPELEPALAREMFEAAQWAQNSDAALSLMNMAARAAKGSPILEALIRDRQDLVEVWRKLDKSQTEAVSSPPDERKKAAEDEIAVKLADVTQRIAAIDDRLRREFPEYASFASPAPISVQAAQSLLGPDEALILVLDTDRQGETPEELFVWIVTKTEVRWTGKEFVGPPYGVVSARHFGQGAVTISWIPNWNVAGAVKALRCGLDRRLWEDTRNDPCASLLASPPPEGAGLWLPFDLAWSHALYRALFGDVEDLIRGKHLLVASSGPLAQLPPQVLVASLPQGVTAGEYAIEDTYEALELSDLEAEDKRRLGWAGDMGVQIMDFGFPEPPSVYKTIRPNLRENPARTAGIKPGDILLKIEGEDVSNVEAAQKKIRAHPSQAPLHLAIWRKGTLLDITAVLFVKYETVVWKPFYLQRDAARQIHWLARDHAISVLPAASSLKALRSVARPSAATRPIVGFGNPLLNGPGAEYSAAAEAARSHQLCLDLDAPQKTLTAGQGGVSKIETRGGLADVSLILKAPPLPETAGELCAVARDLKADQGDVFLGARATESEVKKLSQSGRLAQYRVVHFATHGALAGELRGSEEPGLILTPPDAPSSQDDGYLSASEIAALRLDADWVILSACNTAAGGFKGADAFSGLARAFFYAKARALLASHWEVDSLATVTLITGAMHKLAADRTAGRAEAIRQSMLDLIDHGKQHEAHPAYWAPFVVVGEGGTGR